VTRSIRWRHGRGLLGFGGGRRHVTRDGQRGGQKSKMLGL
jgi:hypothetical protein